MSKSAIDQLGTRLGGVTLLDTDLRMLDQYRQTFAPAYLAVMTTVQALARREPTGPPAKSTSSIIDKLTRESIRLSQMQDIAGLRLLVHDSVAQDETVQHISFLFPKVVVYDRRAKPSHGYRAVHAVVSLYESSVEIQIRTPLQHIWAELSEKLADIVDRTIKYGGGEPSIRAMLDTLSSNIARVEELERTPFDNTAGSQGWWADLSQLKEGMQRDIESIIADFNRLRQG